MIYMFDHVAMMFLYFSLALISNSLCMVIFQ